MAKPSDDDESAAMSYLDVLGCGLGAALLLMILFANRLTGSMGAVTQQPSAPVVVMMDWDTGLPPNGIGSSSIKLTMTQTASKSSSNKGPKHFVGMRTLGTVLQSDTLGGAVTQFATRGLTLLPGKLEPGSEWRVNIELELKQPKEFDASDSEFAEFASRIQNNLSGNIDGLALNEQASAYLAFVDKLIELRRKTAADEAAFFNQPGLGDRMAADFLTASDFGQICRQRADRVKELFGEVPQGSVYPKSLYDTYFRNGKLSVLELDAELFRRSWRELSHAYDAERKLFGQSSSAVRKDQPGSSSSVSGAQVNTLPPRLRWIRTVQALSDPAATIHLRMRIDGPGLDGKVTRLEVRNPLGDGSSRSVDIARLVVSGSGKVTVQWSNGSKPIKGSVPPLATNQEIPEPPLWEIIQYRFDPEGMTKNESVLTTIDNSLRWLDSHAHKANGADEYAGAGTQGLVLMAYIARGHGVNVPASEYNQRTLDLAGELCKRSEGNNGFIQLPSGGHSSVYHFGLGMTALERARAVVSKDDVTLEERLSTALDKTVDCALTKKTLPQPMYRANDLGWSYTNKEIDSSVSVVFAKALLDIAKRPTDSEAQSRRKAKAALPKLHELFATKLKGPGKATYSYREGGAPGDGLPARLPGCLLAEVACAEMRQSLDNTWKADLSTNETWVKAFDAFQAKAPNPAADHGHYEMYYGAHLLMYCAESPLAQKWLEKSSLQPAGPPTVNWDHVRRNWFLNVRKHLREVQKGGNDSLVDPKAADSPQALYQTAMGAILLALPLEQEMSDVYAKAFQGLAK